MMQLHHHFFITFWIRPWGSQTEGHERFGIGARVW